MPGSLPERLYCIRSLLTRDPIVREVGLFAGLGSALSWYGLKRQSVLRRMRVEPIGQELDWIDFGAYGLAWPSAGSPSRLATALVELLAPSNGHYYFCPPTRITPGDVVVDVGACEGGFALESLIRYEAAQVWCFEPDSRMAEALQLTAERNGLEERLQVVPAALGASSGTVSFVESADDPLASYALSSEEPASSTQAVKSIEQFSLDHWAEQEGIPHLDYIKIDAEGSDLAVLQGARHSLERWRPALAVTTYHHPDHCNRMIDYLSSLQLGYRFRVKGLVCFDSVPRPVMLHAACKSRG
ncbi:hypothetical protein BH23GEM7_BH23GEM7_03170 [soil metagenome]|nr:FkbM family methyltransferase [Gemmatimonadota bacterium]